MKVYNFGSINIDEVYQVDEIVRPGETISSHSFYTTMGGKGLNQSVALARSNTETVHVGIINKKDIYIKEFLEAENINTDFIVSGDIQTGKAIIQLSRLGENAIVLSPGANYGFSESLIDKVLSQIEESSIVLSQNETNEVDYLFTKAKEMGHTTVLNMAPINDQSKEIDLNNIDYLIVNEIEGYCLTGKKQPDEILDEFIRLYPNIKVILTLGEKGAIYRSSSETYKVAALKTKVVDTTGAGDTFVGYFISCLMGKSIPDCLEFANCASSIAIGELGASNSIPLKEDVEQRLHEK